MGFRKDHRPEVLGSDHQDAGHEEVVIFVLTGALNLLLEALTLNGGYDPDQKILSMALDFYQILNSDS